MRMRTLAAACAIAATAACGNAAPTLPDAAPAPTASTPPGPRGSESVSPANPDLDLMVMDSVDSERGGGGFFGSGH